MIEDIPRQAFSMIAAARSRRAMTAAARSRRAELSGQVPARGDSDPQVAALAHQIADLINEAEAEIVENRRLLSLGKDYCLCTAYRQQAD